MVLLEVPAGTVEIQVGAYHSRRDITVVRIPASVKAIGENAFWGCSGITTLHLAEGLSFGGGGSMFKRNYRCMNLHSCWLADGMVPARACARACSRRAPLRPPPPANVCRR